MQSISPDETTFNGVDHISQRGTTMVDRKIEGHCVHLDLHKGKHIVIGGEDSINTIKSKATERGRSTHELIV